MRSKLMTAALVGTLGFLVATNPMVVNAAGQITSGQIKNETIKSKDIKNNQVKSVDVKNGSITAADLAPGTVVKQVKSFKRFAADVNATDTAGGDRSFVGATVTIAVDGNDVVSATGTAKIEGVATNDDVDVAICIRPVGSVTEASVLGGAIYLMDDIDLLQDDNLLSTEAVDVPAAGSYTVGYCIDNAFYEVYVENVVGSVTVLDGTGPLAKPTKGGSSRPNEAR